MRNSRLIKAFLIGYTIFFGTSAHAFLVGGENPKMTGNVQQDFENEVSGPDGDLLSSIQRNDLTKIEAALTAGANPNLELCRLIGAGQYRLGLTDNAKCTTERTNFFEITLDAWYANRPAIIALLARFGEIWPSGGKKILDRLTGPTTMYGERRKVSDYTVEKIAVAKAFYDAGVRFDELDIQKSADEWHRNDDNLAVIRGIAEFSGLSGAFEAGVLGESRRKIERDAATQRNSDALIAALQQEQVSKDATTRKQAVLNPSLVKTVGQKICKAIAGSEKVVVGYVFGKPAYGEALHQQYFVTAFIENVVGSKIQLRIAGIRKRDNTGFVNVDHLDGDTVLQPNTVVWDDPLSWTPCD